VDTSITYFEHQGTTNTEAVLRLVAARAATLGITQVVVTTTGGITGVMAPDLLAGLKVIVVTHSTGFAEPGRQEVPAQVVEEIRSKGARVLTATHAFGGAGRAVRRQFSTYQADEIIAQTLRLFGQGTKVAIECSLMAADAGLISVHEEVISCGGTGRGLDTALVLHPSHTQTLFELRVLEILCKPRKP